jgi:hypothetical protein
MYNFNQVYDVKSVSQPDTYADIGKRLLNSKNSLKGELSNATAFKPHLFSLVNTFKSLNAL